MKKDRGREPLFHWEMRVELMGGYGKFNSVQSRKETHKKSGGTEDAVKSDYFTDASRVNVTLIKSF